MKKLLVLELWGIGDVVLASTLIREAVGRYEVHLLGKSHARDLLAPSYPDVIFHEFAFPWTARRRKYRLWTWPWFQLFRLLFRLFSLRFDAAVSVRPDPRDHMLMWLLGAKRRIGFPVKGSQALLTDPLPRKPTDHRVKSWQHLSAELQLPPSNSGPLIRADRYVAPRVEIALRDVRRRIILLHTGAGHPVRRWPEQYFSETVAQLRQAFDFHLVLVPDDDGYGSALSQVADTTLRRLTLPELVNVIARCDICLCNDSGPMHLAAACSRPTIAIFGPGNHYWFRPWGENNKMIIRDICAYRPCFDYCVFPEPYCLTSLAPEIVWPQIREHVHRIFGQDAAA